MESVSYTHLDVYKRQEKYFAEAKAEKRKLDLHAVWNNGKDGDENLSNAVYADTDFVIIAAPTNYDSQKNFFDTSAVESVIEQVMACLLYTSRCV